jgi:hypothetical protein
MQSYMIWNVTEVLKFLHACFLLNLFFNPEDGVVIFLRHIRLILTC